MRTVAPITEQFQHFVRDLRESFWGDLNGQARRLGERTLSEQSIRLRDEAVRRRDHDAVKYDAQKIYRAPSLGEARRAFRRFQWKWQGAYPGLVQRLEQDLPELLAFFRFARPCDASCAPLTSSSTASWRSAAAPAGGPVL